MVGGGGCIYVIQGVYGQRGFRMSGGMGCLCLRGLHLVINFAGTYCFDLCFMTGQLTRGGVRIYLSEGVCPMYITYYKG